MLCYSYTDTGVRFMVSSPVAISMFACRRDHHREYRSLRHNGPKAQRQRGNQPKSHPQANPPRCTSRDLPRGWRSSRASEPVGLMETCPSPGGPGLPLCYGCPSPPVRCLQAPVMGKLGGSVWGPERESVLLLGPQINSDTG